MEEINEGDVPKKDSFSEEDRVDWGKVEVSPEAIGTIASGAVMQCYGVVGMSSRRLYGGLPEILHHDDRRRGVEVKFADGHIVIDLYVVLEYGTRISEVAQNIMSSVKFAVEKSLATPVVQVNVNVQGLRVSNTE